MLSLQNQPTFVFALGSDLNRNDLPSDQDPQRRNSTRSMAETPTSPDFPAVDDNGSHSASGGPDSSSNSSDGERRPHGLPTEWGLSVYHNPLSDSTLVAASSPAPFEYSTNTSSHRDYPAGDVAPKIEELDDGEELHRIRPSDVENQNNATGVPANVPRKRGRPRKHPPSETAPAKITKGRSKTGCITCRRRKKKCDETKPACLNCEKNSVQCEGYPAKEIWKSGKQKLEDAVRTESIIFTPHLPPPMVDGIENELDLRLFDHFVYGFSRVLTLINDDSNPFKEILLPMASQHGGLMHSLLCLSGSHLSGLDPGPEIKDRKNYHFHRAITDLKDSINSTSKRSETEPQLLIEDLIIASTIALSLNTICEGETRGEYRPHMDAARFLLVNQQPRNEKFRQFIVEFFQYHDVSNSLTSLDRRPAHLRGDLRLPDFIPHAQAGAFLGVFDGLFNYISEVTKIRDRIRHRFNEGEDPAVDFQALSDGVTIDSAIRSWEPSHEPNTPNWFLAQLYRQSTWVYLYRTMCPSRPSEKLTCVVDDGLSYLDQLPQDAGAYSIVLMPLFLMGCSAFIPRQRERIKQGFQSLQSYSNLRNIRPAFTVVERVWEVMDSNIEESWDWEKIINSMGMDFLIT